VDRGSLLGMEDWDLLGERRKVVVEDLRFEVEGKARCHEEGVGIFSGK
jgi:hypothetical protein